MAYTESCNSHHRTYTEGVLRGLIWALTGEDPGTHFIDRYDNMREVMETIKIPTRTVGACSGQKRPGRGL